MAVSAADVVADAETITAIIINAQATGTTTAEATVMTVGAVAITTIAAEVTTVDEAATTTSNHLRDFRRRRSPSQA